MESNLNIPCLLWCICGRRIGSLLKQKKNAETKFHVGKGDKNTDGLEGTGGSSEICQAQKDGHCMISLISGI